MQPTFVSLGNDCRVKYQIALQRSRAEDPHQTVSDFNRRLYAASRSRDDPGTFFFDWLVTPITAVISCLDEDFGGVFELDDLELMPTGSVRNRRNGIVFQHNFSKGPDGKVAPDTIGREYDAQRSKVAYLADKNRRLLQGGDRVIYLRVGASDEQIKDLAEVIRRRHPGHLFTIVLVRMVEGEGRRFEPVCDSVLAYAMNNRIEKPKDAHWQGDDARWAWFFADLQDRLTERDPIQPSLAMKAERDLAPILGA